MRILDVDVENVLNQLSEDQLMELNDKLLKEQFYRKDRISSKELKKIINDIFGQQIGDIINDESAEKEVKDKKELKEIQNREKSPSTNGFRTMSCECLVSMISRAVDIKCAEIDELAWRKSLQGAKDKEDIDFVNAMYSDFFTKKARVSEANKSKHKAKELVDHIPVNDFEEIKKKFESEANYTDLGLFGVTFNKDEECRVWNTRILPVDIAQAFEEREKNMKSISNESDNVYNRGFSAFKLAKAFISKKVAHQKEEAHNNSIGTIPQTRETMMEKH